MVTQLILVASIALYGSAAALVVRRSRLRRAYGFVISIVVIAALISRAVYILYKLQTDSTFAEPWLVMTLLELVVAALTPLIVHRVTVVIQRSDDARRALQTAHDEMEVRIAARTADLEAEMAARERATAALNASVRQMRLIVQNLPVMVNAIDDNHLFALWNREAERVTGYRADEIVGNPDAFARLYPDPDYRAQQVELFEKSGGNFRDRDVTITCKGGRKRVIAWSNVSGQYPVPGWRSWAIGVDITERKRAETALREARESLEQQVARRTAELRAANEHLEREIAERRRADTALRRSENQLRATLDALGDYVHVVDRDLRITLVNKTFLQRNRELGLETHPIGRTPFELFPFLPEDVRDEYQRVFATGDMLTTEESTQVGSLTIVTETRKIPILDEGEVTHVVTIVRDITERKQAEEALRQSQDRFKRLYERAPLGYQSLDKDGYFVEVNRAWLDLLGYERGEVIGRRFGDFLTPGSQARFREAFPQFKATGKLRGVELEMTRKDGAVIVASFDGRIGTDMHGEMVQTHSIVSDITERKQAENALRTSEERFRVLVDSMDDVIFTLDTEQRYTAVYGRWLERMGMTPDMYLGKTSREILGREAGAVHEAANARALVGEHVVYEWSAPVLDGEVLYYQTALSPMFDANGSVTGLVGVGRDISALKHAEKDAIRLALEQERRAILANFIRDTSHEFANPLSVIKNSTYLATHTPDPNQRKRHLEMISGQVFHVERLVEGMIMMSRLDGGVEFKMNPLSLEDLVTSIPTRLQKLCADKNQTATFDITSGLPQVVGDEHYLKLAFQHLLDNAIAYTPPGGTITIQVALATSRPDHIVISIADTGIGIAPEHIERIFERFYRVDKARTQRGAGLGLPIVQTIIEEHGGTITVESTPGQGSVFRVFLPIYDR